MTFMHSSRAGFGRRVPAASPGRAEMDGGVVAGGPVYDGSVNLPAGHFGLGHGTGVHAPDEYYLIESTNPKVQRLGWAVGSFVEYLYAMA